ncbi:hypothetical protein GKZ89_18725 [Bacillus mangrovi]|uniref:Uncharacterized protein n=1 Tax=Metabacillus mangrovi TaxID=1491830 RepID=A0A7X2S8G6_9BACI|nr:hypothetical protein [Metabacillus mangrovi]MTH55430.1 hypothetical protein [Metabacillus mangrovi]
MSNLNELSLSSDEIQPAPKAALQKKRKASKNPNRRKMSVPVSETFHSVHDMNKRALEIIAKRV